LGHPPPLEEYADWWRESRSTVFRLQARFREAFPGETTPQRLVDAMKQQKGPTWFKLGVSRCARLALRDAIIEALSGDAHEPGERFA